MHCLNFECPNLIFEFQICYNTFLIASLKFRTAITFHCCWQLRSGLHALQSYYLTYIKVVIIVGLAFMTIDMLKITYKNYIVVN